MKAILDARPIDAPAGNVPLTEQIAVLRRQIFILDGILSRHVRQRRTTQGDADRTMRGIRAAMQTLERLEKAGG